MTFCEGIEGFFALSGNALLCLSEVFAARLDGDLRAAGGFREGAVTAATDVLPAGGAPAGCPDKPVFKSRIEISRVAGRTKKEHVKMTNPEMAT